MSNVTPEEMTEAIAVEVVAKTDKSKLSLVQLEKDYRNAAEFLDNATDAVKDSWIRWLKESGGYVHETRTWRMAIEKEVNSGRTCLCDLLEFLGSPETKERLKSLKELVEVAERLQKLQASGFLDAMTDVMLKHKP